MSTLRERRDARILARAKAHVFEKDEIALRGGSGLGDAIYLQSVARHYLGKGFKVEVCSDWHDVFLPLLGRIKVSPFRRDRINKVAHYTSRKRDKGSDQFLDCCLNAGIREPVELNLGWRQVSAAALAPLRKATKPVVLVQLPRSPMGRRDGFGAELLPDCKTIQRVIDKLKGKAFLVQIGKGVPLFRFRGLDLDLSNRTSVAGMIDIASVANGVLGYCSFVIPLAEALNKPALLVWSRKGLNAPLEFVRTITPQKVFHRATSKALMDDCTDQELTEAVHEFLEQVRGREPVPEQVGCDRREWAGVAAE